MVLPDFHTELDDHRSQKSGSESSSAFLLKRLLLSAFIPAVFIFTMWIVKVAETLFDADLAFLGIYPREINGLAGILLSPFLHSTFSHVAGNSIPLIFLGTALFYFYRDFSFKIIGVIWLFSGAVTWLFAREAWHIGASGILYGLASFLFFSGIIRKYFRLMALSLLIVFLYGSMIWGMFPEIYDDVSWEGHSAGFIAGIIMAIVFRNEGPSNPVYEWMNEEEHSEAEQEDPQNKPSGV